MYGMDKTITVWNKWRNPETRKDEWYRHVVPRCSWEADFVSGISGTGAVVGSIYSVLIEANADYLPRRDWEALADKTTAFTLSPGDLVALGAVAREITVDAPETKLKTDLSPDAFIIKAATDRSAEYKQAPHYEVEGV